MDMLTENTVHRLRKAVRHLNTESHALMGFVRFSVYGETLVSVIEPKNRVLPLLAAHFCDRYRKESFMIYDKTHGQALIHRAEEAGAGKAEIVDVDELILPEAGSRTKRTAAFGSSFTKRWRSGRGLILGRRCPICPSATGDN